jgi:hypothetical protein
MARSDSGKTRARKAVGFDAVIGGRLRALRLLKSFAQLPDGKAQALVLDLCETLAAKR